MARRKAGHFRDMVRFNSDVVFIDTSGQVRSRNGDLTLRADDTGSRSIICGSGITLRPEIHSAMDLGTDDLRWRIVWSQINVAALAIYEVLIAEQALFITRPTVNGSGVLLQGELATTPVAEYYLSADSGSFTTTLTTIPLNTTVVQDAGYFSRSGGIVTVNRTGLYRVSYSASIRQTGGNSRSMTRHQVTLNGVTLIPQSASWVYSRNNNEGEGTATKTFLVQLNASDTIRVQSVRDDGGGTFQHLAGSNLSLQFIRAT